MSGYSLRSFGRAEITPEELERITRAFEAHQRQQSFLSTGEREEDERDYCLLKLRTTPDLLKLQMREILSYLRGRKLQ